ncbi:MAG: beta-glucosidase BglX [Enterococcus lemanii]|jgi:beta-glucosidase
MKKQEIIELINQLTLDEKIGQLVQLSGDFFQGNDLSFGPQQKLGIDKETINLIGSVLNVAGAEITKKIQTDYLERSRHKIPLLFMADIIYGYRTIFPIPLGLGATWNPELIQNAYSVAAQEAKVAGVHVTYAPMVDLVRDARWGRCLESTGEDPLLNSDFAKAMVEGIQQETNGQIEGIAACVKHFAAYGASESGRDYNTVDMSERRLRQDYLSGYKAAVEAGCKLVMTSFNTYDGIPATANQFLLKEILREEWNFDGVIISDYAAVQELIPHGIAKDDREATKLAIEATNDIDMKTRCYAKELRPLLESGEIDPQLIDDAVYRVLKLKSDLGLFEDPYRESSLQNEEKVLLSKKNRELSKKVASEAIVLLQNKQELLPLTPNKDKILLVGPYGDNQSIIGLWAVHGKTKDVTTLKSAFTEVLTDEFFCYEPGCPMMEDNSLLGDFGFTTSAPSISAEQQEEWLTKALEAGAEADVIIFAMGEHSLQSGEAGSRTDISLPAIQKKFIKKMKALGKKNILINFSGRPIVLSEETEVMDAILQAWFPGTEGARAITDILFGKVNPSGRLSMSFPASVGQLPIYYNSFSTGRPLDSDTHVGRFVSKYLDCPNEPIFPFGFGLSYGKVSYHSLKLSKPVMDETIQAEITIKNDSDISRLETVQLYIKDHVGSVVRPVKELKKYQKITLSAFEEKTIYFTIKKEDLYYYQKDMTFGVEPGTFTLFIGKNSSEGLSKSFELI